MNFCDTPAGVAGNPASPRNLVLVILALSARAESVDKITTVVNKNNF